MLTVVHRGVHNQGKLFISNYIYLEPLKDTLVVGAYECQDVAIFDVPLLCLNADMPDEKYVRLKFEGEVVDIMCDVNPDHTPNIPYKSVKKVVHLRVLKALYGNIEASLFLYYICVNT